MLQCVAMCCSVLQKCELRVAERDVQSFNLVRDVLQGVKGCCRAWRCVAVCCSVLQCVAMFCNVLQCVAK